MAVQLAAVEEVAECVLVDARRPPIGKVLLFGDGIQQQTWDDQPPDPKRGASVLQKLLAGDHASALRRQLKTYYLGDFPAERLRRWVSQGRAEVPISSPSTGVRSAASASRYLTRQLGPEHDSENRPHRVYRLRRFEYRGRTTFHRLLKNDEHLPPP